MRNSHLLLLVFVALPIAVSAQKFSIRSYAGYELSGDHVTADFTLGVAVRYKLSELFYLEPYLRAGYGSVLHGRVYPRYPENYVGKFQDYVYEHTVKHDDVETGLSSKVNDSDLFFLINGYQLGIQTTIGKFNGYAGAGLSIGYMDYQSLGEAGDAYFNHNGEEVLMWYSIPAYQRGFGLQASFTTGFEKQWEDWSLGVRSDLDFGSFGLYALGTRLSLSISIGILLL